MKFFQKKKNDSRLGKLVITSIIICGVVIFSLIINSTMSVGYIESKQQSELVVSKDESETAIEDSRVEISEASEMKEEEEISEMEDDEEVSEEEEEEEASEIESEPEASEEEEEVSEIESEPEVSEEKEEVSEIESKLEVSEEEEEVSEIENEPEVSEEEEEVSEMESEPEASEMEDNQTSESEIDESSEFVNSHIIKGVNGIYQFPELPTGCEVTALTCLVNSWGINVDKVDLAMNYMPRAQIYYEGNQIYGPNPMYNFVGDPSIERGSFGCFSPCLVRTFENYVVTNQELAEKYVAIDLSGQSFESILQEYVANDCPVLIIVSPFLREPKESITWNLEDGGTWTWQQGHHAMVVYGFDLESNEVYVADSAIVTGMATYDLTDVEDIYIKKGMSAMTILPK